MPKAKKKSTANDEILERDDENLEAGDEGEEDEDEDDRGSDAKRRSATALKKENERLKALLKKKKAKPADDEHEEDDVDDEDESEEDDEDLLKKAKRVRAREDRSKGNAVALESALKFDLDSEAWLKKNASLLPKEVSELFESAKKEKYDSAIQKVSAIKSGIVKSFFDLKANHDLLTEAQKVALKEYLELTQSAKHERAGVVYDTIFEPTFEMLRRIKKAEALSKGHGDSSDNAYCDRMIELSKKHYFGDK